VIYNHQDVHQTVSFVLFHQHRERQDLNTPPDRLDISLSITELFFRRKQRSQLSL